jgi:hypothetical protein
MDLALPSGLFNTFLDLWSMIRPVYVGILEWFTSTAVDLTFFGYGNFSVLSVVLGVGIYALLGSWIWKFIKSNFL